MHDNTLREKFIELRAQGLTLDAISSKIGIPRATLGRWNRLWLQHIQRLRALQWELLEDQIGQRLEDSLQSIALRIRRLQQQLDTCDITDSPPPNSSAFSATPASSTSNSAPSSPPPSGAPSPDPFPDSQNDSIEAMKDRWMMSSPAPQNETSQIPVVASTSAAST